MKKIIALCAFLWLSQLASAQKSDSLAIATLFREMMLHGTAHENLRQLCKQIGPRLSGSPEAARAVEMTKLMLEQAGADTVYLQPCMVPHWVRGKNEHAELTLSDGVKLSMKMCALGNSVGTPASGTAGNVVEVESIDELEKLGEKGIKGKIVFLNKSMNPLHVRTFKAYGECGIMRWGGPSVAARYGAVAAVVRSLASNVDEYPHTGVTEYNDSFPKIPAIAISTNDAEQLSELLKKDARLQLQLFTSCQMLPDELSYNVIGEIRGSVHPDRYITVGGHLDSWDLAEGAHDDGAGCMQSIEIIRAFKNAGIKPHHTIRAVMFMNEENGGRGGEAYFAAAKEKGEQHLFAIESDAGGFTPRGFATGFSEKQFQQFLKWKKLFEPYDLHQFSNDGNGSDIYHLKALGCMVSELRPDSQRYFDIHHAATDTFESVSKRELLLGAFSMGALIYLMDMHPLK